MMEVKGSVLQTMKSFITKEHTRDEFGCWLEKLPAEVRLIFKVTPSASNWYGIQDYLVTPTKVYCDMFHDGDIAGSRLMGRFNAEQSLKGVYSLFVKMGSVNFIIQRATKILPLFYRPCGLTVAEHGDRFCSVHVTEFPDMDEYIEQRIAGWMEKALEIHGCSNITIDIPQSIVRGDAISDYRIFWE